MQGIVGHNKQKELLLRFLKNDSLPHALLFCGPEKVGKRTIAFRLANLLICENSTACGKCGGCVEMEKGLHPDFFFVSPEDGLIKIEQINELIKGLSLKSSGGKTKVAIIDEAHLINYEAQNALLKTLEEPQGKTVIILVTSHPSILLPTILSRSFKLRFSFVSNEEIKKVPGCERFVSFSFGRPGLAMDYLNDPESEKKEKSRQKDFLKMKKEDLSFRFAKVKEVAKEEHAEEIVSRWMSYLREEFFEKTERGEDTKKIREVITKMENAILINMKTKANFQLALEEAIMKI